MQSICKSYFLFFLNSFFKNKIKALNSIFVVYKQYLVELNYGNLPLLTIMKRIYFRFRFLLLARFFKNFLSNIIKYIYVSKHHLKHVINKHRRNKFGITFSYTSVSSLGKDHKRFARFD